MTESDPKAKAREAAHSAARKEAEAGSLGTRITDAALDAYEAALSAPAGATRLVRIAVAYNSADDEWGCCVVEAANTDQQIFDELDFDGCTRHPTIVEARIPVRDVPVVAGDVKEAG